MTRKHRTPYNTALHNRGGEFEGRDALGETRYAETARGVLFQHDVCEPFSEHERKIINAKACCIYSEPPWPAGWEIFHKRAGVRPRGTYADYLHALKANIIHGFNKPTFLFCGKTAAKVLEPPLSRAIKLNGDQVMLAAWNSAGIPSGGTSGEFAAALSSIYSSAYDFSAGYGNALRPFEYFVASDIDAKCLNYIETVICQEDHKTGARAA